MPIQKQLLLPFAFVYLAFSLHAQNDKQVIGDAVFTPEEIGQGVEVMFMIRFQNIGLDTAGNIVVRDTLDPRFDAGTLKVLETSHSYQLLRDQGYIRWYFNNINLPAVSQSGQEFSGSRGYIIFTVEPHRFLHPGQTIQNRAAISFDESAPYCTNYATIWIDEGAEIPDLVENDGRALKIVPNPNHGSFEVRQTNEKPVVAPAENVQWWISDMNGKTVWDGSSLDVAAASNEVMLEKPAPGLYMLWMKENGRLQVERFAVIR